jgi:hypothetical protein
VSPDGLATLAEDAGTCIVSGDFVCFVSSVAPEYGPTHCTPNGFEATPHFPNHSFVRIHLLLDALSAHQIYFQDRATLISLNQILDFSYHPPRRLLLPPHHMPHRLLLLLRSQIHPRIDQRTPHKLIFILPHRSSHLILHFLLLILLHRLGNRLLIQLTLHLVGIVCVGGFGLVPVIVLEKLDDQVCILDVEHHL